MENRKLEMNSEKSEKDTFTINEKNEEKMTNQEIGLQKLPENLPNQSSHNESPEKNDPLLSKEKGLPENASKAFEAILHECGDYNLYQWKLTVISGLCGFFTALHNFGAVFLAATPEFSCDIPYLQGYNITETDSLYNKSLPWVRGKDGNLQTSKCEYYDLDVTSVNDSLFGDGSSSLVYTNDTQKCESWDYSDDIYKSTLVTEWDLVCDRRWLMSTTQASYMMGILVGAVVFSAISDKFGRRFSTLVCTCLMICASISAAFSRSFAVFLLLRFIVAASGQGMYLVNYVILMEVVSIKGRNTMVNLSHSLFTVGFLTLSLLAYLIRDWRKLQLAMSVPTTLLILHFWLLPESPRWLLMQGKEDEGISLLKSVAKTNNKTFPKDEELRPLLEVIRNEVRTRDHKTFVQSFKSVLQITADLVRTPNMRRRSLILFYCWFVVSMVAYGLVFSGSTLDASAYLIVLLSALGKIPSLILIICLLFIIGRRTLYGITLILAGLSCASIILVPTDWTVLKIILVIFGRMNVSIAFGLSYMLSAELVPTQVRNLSLGMASMFARIGSASSPYIIDLLGDIYYGIPFLIFGALALLAGVLGLLLPETGNKRLPETIEEIEAMPR